MDLENATPMMRQYLSVKAEHPSSLVLVRMGDFFEAFYDDAKAIAELLDLTLTARAKEKDSVPMAGFPHRALDTHLRTLLRSGHRVAICDQVEDASLAKGLVRREVTRILTPGTFVDPDAPARSVRVLAAVFADGRDKGAYGLAALDVATGAFRATSLSSAEAALEELVRLEAREVLVPLDAPSIAGLSELRAVVSAVPVDELRGALEGHFGKEEIAGLEKHLSVEALSAADMALAYADRTQLAPGSLERAAGARLAHVSELRPYVPDAALVLDQEARQHLELFRAAGEGGRSGTLLGAIDETVSSMGARLLVDWIARPLRDARQIARRQDAVAALLAEQRALDAVRAALREIHDLPRLLGRVAMGRSNPRDLAALRGSLTRAPELLAALAPCSAARLVELRGVDALPDLAARLQTTLAEDPPTELGNGRVFAPGFDAELDRLIDLSERGKEVLLDIERRERERTQISSLKVRFNRVFGYYIEITKANLKSVPKDYIRKQTTAGGERYYTEELKTYEEQIASADELRLERERGLYATLVREITAESARVMALAGALAEIDVLASFAALAQSRGWTRPRVDEGERIEIKEGRHPVLERLSRELGEAFVPNDLTLAEDRRLMILTGPNMAGKSTIMRQTALIVILAQMGAYVPAASASVGVVDRVFTRVGASDDLSRGRSTFMVEMAETARILRSATRRSLLLIDEIGRGTSTFDGLAIAWAVAEHLHDVVGAKTIFATHYHELTELARERPQAVNAHVAVKEWNDKIVFLRKLESGPTNKSYGVQVARLAGLPSKVIARARRVLAALEAQELAAGDRASVLAKSAGASAPQLHLFAPPQPPASEAERAALERLRGAAIDDLSPREAHALLAEIQAALDGAPRG